MPGIFDTLVERLYQNEPDWYLSWATGSELESYSRDVVRATSATDINMVIPQVQDARKRLKDRITQRMLHRVVNAAYGAEIITSRPHAALLKELRAEVQDWADALDGERPSLVALLAKVDDALAAGE